MIDLHSHILPSVDDGAGSPQVSLDMLDAAGAMGIRTIVATPHLVGRLTPAYDAQVHGAFRLIESHARASGIVLLSGFEIRLSPDLPSRLAQGEPITLNGGKVVLVDLPPIDWPHHVDSTLFEIQTAGFLPILAHPERYTDIQKDPSMGLRLAERGIGLQVTIGSFSGIFGKRAKRAAEELVRLGAVHLAATDAHSAGHRMAAVPEGLRRLNKMVGEVNLQQLAVHTPNALLQDGVLPDPITPSTQPKSRMLRMFG